MLVLVLTQNNHLNSSDYDCDVQADDGGDVDDGADVLLRYGEVFAQLSFTWVALTPLLSTIVLIGTSATIDDNDVQVRQ